MIKIAEYTVLEVIHKGKKTIVYRALRNSDQKPLILKILNSEYPSFADKAQIQREYDILNLLNIPGVIKTYGIETFKNTLILVLEDFGGNTLKRIISQEKLSPEIFLQIAIQLVDTLGEIHQRSVIHKDLKPQNILVNIENHSVKISDFSISSFFSRESQKMSIPDQLEGTLGYISPEQTGWMNRIIDYRTDFYTLGITFYEMLTGNLPFEFSDPMELIHAQLAIEPAFLHDIDPDIPVTISAVVSKLLAKNAENRYKTTTGIKKDLELCREYIEKSTTVDSFVPGLFDISDHFKIPQKLYGRESEVKLLMEAIKRASQDTGEMVIISGPSGIGKSSLVQEVVKYVIGYSGFFISGKFEQFNRDIPYYAFMEAFNGLINYLLTMDHLKVQLWKDKIKSILGNNGQVIIDFIPRLKLIIGDQPPVATLGSLETQSRIHLLLQKFIDLFTSPEHPLMIFIDDLQWADASSIKLIKVLMTNAESRNMIFIGAYRTSEKEVKNDYLAETIRNIENYRHHYNLYSNRKLPVNFIHVGAIDKTAITMLLEDTLNSHSEQTKALAELIEHQTAGNPFFIHQFLSSNYQDGFILFQKEKNTWDWNIDQIRKKGVTENVIQLMVEKIGRASKETRSILELASCIGGQFDLKTLSNINNKSLEETDKQLIEATKEEYVLLVDRSDNDSAFASFQFLHDQIRYAAYSMIEENRKKEIHRKIADLIIEQMKNKSVNPVFEVAQLSSFGKYVGNEKDIQGIENWLGDDLFLLTNNLNLSGDIISDPLEITIVTALNLIAARKAKKSAAFETALDYLHIVINKLPDDMWTTNYFLTLSLYNETAECEYINTSFIESEELCKVIIKNSLAVLDKVKVCEIRIASLTPQNKLKEAIETGLAFLQELGVYLPSNPGKLTPLPGFMTTWLKIRNHVEQLANLPEMQDPEKIAAMNILVQMHAPSFISSPNLTPMIVLELNNLSLKYGISENSAYGFVCLGMILSSAFGKYSYGYRFGKLAVEILYKFQPSNMDCKVLFLYGNTISHWQKPILENQSILEDAYHKGIESGDKLFASYSLNWINIYNFLMRKPIQETLIVMERDENIIVKIHQQDAIDLFHLWRQFIINLSENNKISVKFSSLIFDEEITIPLWEKIHNDTCLYSCFLLKAILHYLQKDYPSALNSIELSIPHESGVFGMPVIPEHNFFYSLILAAAYGGSDNDKNRKTIFKKLQKNQSKMKIWANNSPANYMHKYLIIAGEVYRIKGDKKAVNMYETAIKSARQYKYILEEALANELLSQYYFDIKKSFIAQGYIREAFYQYNNWGGRAKAFEMLEEFPEILQNKSVLNNTSTETETYTSNTSETLDFKTVLKVSQNISSEINLERLVEKLMKITIENAGAQRGFLILSRGEDLYISAEGKIDSVKILPSIPIKNYEEISHAIVNYVKTTMEVVVLNDVTEENQFKLDPYIIRTKPKSILCAPVIKQNKLIGIIYLENNLMPNVFTRRRLDVLNLLTLQAVISLENAMYVEQIKKVNLVLEKEIKQHKDTEEALRLSRERYALAARGANDGLWDWDLVKDEIYYSPRWKEMLGYDEKEINQEPAEWFNRVHPEDLSMVKSAISSHIEGTHSHFESEYRLQHKNGSYLWMITRGLVVRDASNRPYRLAGSQTEITKRKVAEDQLRYDALHDSLTGLPNWNLLLDRMMHAINQKKRRPGYVCCILFLDIDRFKIINDSLGHEIGNMLLIEYAKILQNCITPEDTVARLGGDEFVILLENITDINEAIKITNKIRSKLTSPFIIKDHELFVTVSIGVVIINPDYQKPEEILRDADNAMHRAKVAGGNRYQIYDKTMHSRVIGFLKLEGELRKALEKKELLVYYQPIISSENGEICGAEALVRWNKNQETLMLPGDFIEVAEENGLIIPIGQYVLSEVCRQIKIWQQMRLPDLTVAVNLSPKQFEQDDLLQMVDDTLQSANVQSRFLQFELTETILMKNISYGTKILESLKRMGIHISIDDFGTGYSSLNYLKNFPVSKLKIDKSFIQNINSTGSNDKAIIKAIIAMGKSMNMRVVAEGVETLDQLKFLQYQHCHEYQGYYFSKPLSAENFTAFFKNHKPFDMSSVSEK
jgi:diguanylate cyclase (GGDEF)-like protein/PAS domain S-box-containing protein